MTTKTSIGQVTFTILASASVILKERNREMCGVQSLMSLLLFLSHANKHVNFVLVYAEYMQVYARLNHVNTCLSYSATLRVVEDISKLHNVPLEQWIADDISLNSSETTLTRRWVYVMYE